MDYLNKLVNLFKKSADKNSLPEFLNQYNRKTKFIISLSTLGLILFLALVSIAPFRDKLLSSLYPKQKSHAEEVSAPLSQTDIAIQSLNDVTKQLAEKITVSQNSGASLVEGETGSVVTDIRTLAESRKNLLLKVINLNPEAALTNIQSSESNLIRDTLLDLEANNRIEVNDNLKIDNKITIGSETSTSSNFLVEKQEKVEGNLNVIIGEVDYEYAKNINPSLSTFYRLTTADKKIIALHPAKNYVGNLMSGMKVSVNGYRLDNDLVFDVSSQDGVSVISKPNIDMAKLLDGNNQKTAIIIVNFQNASFDINKDVVRDVVFNKTSGYYREATFGKLTGFTGDVFGPYNMPQNQMSLCDDAASSLFFDALSTALPQARDFNQYSRIAIVAPFAPKDDYCIFDGYAQVWNDIPIPQLDGGIINANKGAIWIKSEFAHKENLWAHEIGHTFYLNHARYFNCGSLPLSAVWRENCFIEEYEDWYDDMGGAYFEGAHFNAAHKEQLGVFQSSNLRRLEPNETGTYVIEPIETPTSGLKALKIPRGNGSYLYVEYRGQNGYDLSFLKFRQRQTNVYYGALFHITFADGDFPFTYLFNAAPPSSYYTPALTLGQTFIDPVSKKNIKVINQTDGGLTVEVTEGNGSVIWTQSSSNVPETSLTDASNCDLEVKWNMGNRSYGGEVLLEYNARKYRVGTTPSGSKTFTNQITDERCATSSACSSPQNIGYGIYYLTTGNIQWPSDPKYDQLAWSRKDANTICSPSSPPPTTPPPNSNLSVTLSPNPSSGNTPLNVGFTAAVGGSTTGNIDYTLYCNKTDGIASRTLTGSNQTTYTTDSSACRYSSAGIYTAKMIVRRGGVTAEGTANIVVSSSTTPPPTQTPIPLTCEEGARNLIVAPNPGTEGSNIHFTVSSTVPPYDNSVFSKDIVVQNVWSSQINQNTCTGVTPYDKICTAISPTLNDSVIWKHRWQRCDNGQCTPAIGSPGYCEKFVNFGINSRPRTWTINAEPVCTNGMNPQMGTSQLSYGLWPPVPLNWIDAGSFNKSITSAADTTTIYVGLKAYTGEFLQPVGAKPQSVMQYSQVFNPPTWAVSWSKNDLPEGTYTIQFQAPASMCTTSASCPSPGTKATLSWPPVNGASKYYVVIDDIRDSLDCSRSPYDSCFTVSSTQTSTITSPGLSYNWRVSALDSNLNTIQTSFGPNFNCNP